MKFNLFLFLLIVLFAIVILADDDKPKLADTYKSCAKGICEQCGGKTCCRSPKVCAQRFGEGHFCDFNSPSECKFFSGGRCGVCSPPK
ncbi:hypothetical protein RclHR1_03820009 [Rhizophagus clarus]|uniref:Uncharacterized protein n=1 Tax=Rhizophagus clarus TaxID=94130 RepID=A0A2Z6RDZ1_9GLOM|nr:hypothetical protein RclHR1_03820009 [Rhizophagus clarus]